MEVTAPASSPVEPIINGTAPNRKPAKAEIPKLPPEAEAMVVEVFSVQDHLTNREYKALADKASVTEAQVRKGFANLRSSVQRSLQRAQRQVPEFAAAAPSRAAEAVRAKAAASGDAPAASQPAPTDATAGSGAPGAPASPATPAVPAAAVAQQRVAAATEARQFVSQALAPMLDARGGVRDALSAAHFVGLAALAKVPTSYAELFLAALATRQPAARERLASSAQLQGLMQDWLLEGERGRQVTMCVLGMQALRHLALLVPSTEMLELVTRFSVSQDNQRVADAADELLARWREMVQRSVEVGAVAIPSPAASGPAAEATRGSSQQAQHAAAFEWHPPPECAPAAALLQQLQPLSAGAGLGAEPAGQPVSRDAAASDPEVIPFVPVDRQEAVHQNFVMLRAGINRPEFVWVPAAQQHGPGLDPNKTFHTQQLDQLNPL